MRKIIIIILFLGIQQSFAQSITGKIRDLSTGRILQQVKVQTSIEIQHSNTQGEFTIWANPKGDSLTISLPGYDTQRIMLEKGQLKTKFYIDLKEHVTEIETIAIEGKSNKKSQDQQKILNLPIEKKPKYRKFFHDRTNTVERGLARHMANGSTASLISLNVLSIIGALKKDKGPKISKEELYEQLDTERFNVDQIFNKKLISELTGLKGDRLQIFQNTYRPRYAEIIQMSEYDIRLFIESSFKDFQEQNKSWK